MIFDCPDWSCNESSVRKMKPFPVIFMLKCAIKHYDWGMKGKGQVYEFALQIQFDSSSLDSQKPCAEVNPHFITVNWF